MKNPLRIINDRYENLKLLSPDTFVIFLVLIAFPLLIDKFFPFNTKLLAIPYLTFAFLLFIDNYFKQKQKELGDSENQGGAN